MQEINRSYEEFMGNYHLYNIYIYIYIHTHTAYKHISIGVLHVKSIKNLNDCLKFG